MNKEKIKVYTYKGVSTALICFDKLYFAMNDVERRQFIEALIAEIQIYEERKPNGQWLKSIRFKLPIIENDLSIGLDNGGHVENIVLLSKLHTKQNIEVELEMSELDLTAAESKATYAEIKQYVLDKYVLYAHGKAIKPNNVSVGERNIIALCCLW